MAQTLEFVFADGRPGRLFGEEGLKTEHGVPVVLCRDLADFSEVAPGDAGTLYVLQMEGEEESPLIAPAREGGYTIEVQVGQITLPEAEPEGGSRRRRSRED